MFAPPPPPPLLLRPLEGQRDQILNPHSATFHLEPNNYVLLSYGTCGIGIQVSVRRCANSSEGKRGWGLTARFQNQIASSPIGCSQRMCVLYTSHPATPALILSLSLIFQGLCTSTTCAPLFLRVFSLLTSPMQDYPDWAAVAHYLAWNCQAAQGANGGRCTGRTGIYQKNVPDFYIQYVARSPLQTIV